MAKTVASAPDLLRLQNSTPTSNTVSESEDDRPFKDVPKMRVASDVANEVEDDIHNQWEDESIYDDIEATIDSLEAVDMEPGENVCTPAEARYYRERLHQVGPGPFIYEMITCGKVTARKLCTAFGVKTPPWLDDRPDIECYRFLGYVVAREISRRRRLPEYRSIEDAARLLRERSNIMVITGAGISTSLGIPDFRSKNTGFYSKLQNMGYNDPEEVFDIRQFDEDPSVFFNLAGDILPDLRKWTPTHQFIRLIQDENKLLTNYTQNIDNIESHAGIKPEKLIQCHGSWATATCRKCGHQIPGEDIFDDIRAHQISRCKKCEEDLRAPKPGMKRKRNSNGSMRYKRKAGQDYDSDSDGAYDLPEPGVMKPDITFFGEGLPKKFFERLTHHDKQRVDLVIVIGTSMKVAPVSEVPHTVPPDVPQIYISRDPIRHINFDINLLGDCDVVVTELCRLAGWDLRHEMIPNGQEIRVQRYEDSEYTWTVEAVKKPAPGPRPTPGRQN